MQFEADIDGRLRRVVVHRIDGQFRVDVDDRAYLVDARMVGAATLSLLLRPWQAGGAAGGISYEVTLSPGTSGQVDVHMGGAPIAVSLNGRRRWRRQDDAAHGPGGPERVVAPMPGKVVRVLVQAGTPVRARQPLVVIEAMKMENELRARSSGIVTDVAVREGQSLDAGELVAIVASDPK